MSIPIKIKRKADGSIDNITFCPTVTIEKQVWESTLHRSMMLQAENDKLKDALKDCQEKILLMDYDSIKIEILQKINEVLK